MSLSREPNQLELFPRCAFELDLLILAQLHGSNLKAEHEPRANLRTALRNAAKSVDTCHCLNCIQSRRERLAYQDYNSPLQATECITGYTQGSNHAVMNFLPDLPSILGQDARQDQYDRNQSS